MKKPLERTVTLHFIDGTKLSLEFPEQTGSPTGRKLKMSDFLAGQHVVIEAEGSILVCPMANIKYMSFTTPTLDATDMKEALPRHAIVGASIRF
jgi:hypothetical protein